MKAPIMLLLALVAGVLAGPINLRVNEPNICATRCVESKKFKYEPGTTYVFDYNAQTETGMEGASEDKAVLGISATAHVEVISNCDMALRLSNVRLAPQSSSQFTRSLEENALRFSFQDGSIEDLCPPMDETDWSLNIKRGVLSTFQNSMDNLENDGTVQETDVTGSCPAEYTLVNKGWYTKSIKKTKNLLGCMDRHGWRSAMHGSPYRVPSDIQSLPLIKSDHVCNQEIDTRGGHMTSSVCKETHVFRPFSHYNNGSLTKVVQKLNFRNKMKGVTTRQSYIDKRASLLFTHSNGHKDMERKQQEVLNKLTTLCQVTIKDIRPEVPTLFSDMIFQMRGLDATSLRNIERQVSRGSLCPQNTEKTKKFFLDAIPMVGTSSSVQLLKELVINKEVTGIQAEMWLTSLALIQEPTLQMLSEVKAILNMNELGDKSMLPISSLVNNYCRKNPNCADEHEVTGIISALERNLGYGCYVRDENLQKVLLTLRAIGNAGHSSSVAGPLSHCLTRQSNPIEVRVAALDAFRRLPCSADRIEAMSLLEDKDEDSELRIAAYLTVMNCPTEDNLNEIRALLAAEEANQVGSFIWSHLTNLMETDCPHKQNLKSIVDDETLKKEFDLEKVKYSKNYEGSFMFDRLNTGAMVESNVIWSSKSFIPRSAMVNLTVDLFGNSVNLFEVGGRIEGLEYLLETYLGPFGYFGEKSSKTSVEKSRAKLEQMRGSVYMRVFGNEMMYNHFKGFDDFKSKDFNFLEFLIKISKDHDYSFSQSMMFLDSSMVIPTAAGLPLNLTVNGVTSIDLKASGSVDLRKVATSPRSLHIDGIIKPSGAVTISGSMSVDALFTKSGMKMTSTLHSSTALKTTATLQRGKILEIDIDTPEEKMEVLDIKSSFFTIMGDVEKEQEMIKNNYKTRSFCSGKKMADLTGVELCGELSYPNASMVDAAPYFPFTGPVSMSLILHKRDTHSGYKLLAKRLETKEKSVAQLAFDTPGSKTKRKISMDMVIDFKNKEVEVSATSPWTKMVLKGNAILEEKQKAFIGSFVKDDEKYEVRSIVDVNNEGKLTKLSPRIEVSRPGAKDIVLAGSVEIEGKKRFETDLSLIGVIDHPISLKGAIVDTSKEKSIRGSIQFDKRGEYTMEAVLEMDISKKKSSFMRIVPRFAVKTPVEHLISVDGDMEHRPGKVVIGKVIATVKDLLRKPISIAFNNVRVERKKFVRYDTDIKIASQWLTAKVDGTVNKVKSGVVSSRVVLDYTIHKVTKNKIIMSGKFNNKSTKSLTKYSLSTNFDVKNNPEYNFITKLDLAHNKRHSEATVEVRYGKWLSKKTNDKRIFMDATFNHKGNKAAAKADYEIIAELPMLDLNFTLSGEHKHDRNDLQNNLVLEYGKGQKVKSDLKLSRKAGKVLNMVGDFNLAFPKNQISIITDLTQVKKEYTHNLNVKINKRKLSITTKYGRPNKDKHVISSQMRLPMLIDVMKNYNLDIDMQQPITFSGSTVLNFNKFRAAAEVEHGKSKYGFTTSKISQDKYNHVVDLEVYCPYRKLSADLDTTMKGSQYGGKLAVNWDVENRNANTKVVLDGGVDFKSLADMNGNLKIIYPGRTISVNASHKGNGVNTDINTHVDVAWNRKDKINMDLVHSNRRGQIDTDLTVTTPFEILPKLSTVFSYNKNPSDTTITGMVSWADQKQISTGITMKPFKADESSIEIELKTPFVNYRSMSAAFSHKFANTLTATLKAKLEKQYADIEFQINPPGSIRQRGPDALITFKSNFKDMESIIARLNYVSVGDRYIADVSIDHNSKKYSYDLDMTANGFGWNMNHTGKLIVSAPYHRSTSNWNLVLTDSDFKTDFSTTWNRKYKIQFDVSGSYSSSATKTLNGKITLQTPWNKLRDVIVDFNNEFERESIVHSTTVKRDQRVIGSSSINYRRGVRNVIFNVAATTPYTEDLSGSLNVETSSPYNSRMELQWAPRMKIVADGFISGDLPTTLDGSLSITTPFKHLRSIVVTANNKKEGGVWITTGNVEYNVRKTVEVETRLGWEDQKMFKAKLLTPFDKIRELETGFHFSNGMYDINSQAEFKLLPIVEKFATSLNANWRSDITGTLRLDTPFKEFRYAQADVSSRLENTGRNSKIEIEYYPGKVITLDSLYNLDSPYTFDIKLKTPFEHLKQVGGSVRHMHNQHHIQTHAEINYAPHKTLEGDLLLTMKDGIDGSLVVKTPSRGYEVSRSTFKHNGILTNFQSSGDVQIGNKIFDAEINFSHDSTTSGSIIFHSPFDGFEELKASVTKNGELDDFTFKSSFNYGKNKEIKAYLDNKIRRGLIKTNIFLKNPYTAPFKLDFDHYGLPNNFQTKLSSSLGHDNMVEADTKFNIQLPSIDLSSDVDYLLDGEGRKFGIKLNKDGEWNNTRGEIRATCDEHVASVVGNFKFMDNIMGSLTVEAPYFEDKDISVSFSHDGSLHNFKSEGNIRYLDSTYTGNVNFFDDGVKQVRVSCEISTPYQGYEQMGYAYNHEMTNSTLVGHAKASYGYNKEIVADISLSNAPMSCNIIVTTPFENYTTNRLILKGEGEVRNFRLQGEAELLGEILKVITNFRLNGNTSGLFTMKGSSDKIKDTTVSFEKTGGLNDFTAKAAFNYDGKKVIECSVNNTYKPQERLSSSLSLQGMFMEDLDLSFSHSGIPLKNCSTKLRVSLGSKISAGYESKITDGDDSMTVILDGDYKYYGSANRAYVNVVKRGELTDGGLHATGKINEGEILAQATYKISADKVHVDASVNTPFINFTDLAANVDYNRQGNRYNAGANLRYMDGQEVSATGSLYQFDWKRVEANLQVNTPFGGFEETKLDYKHTVDGSSVDSNISAEYGNRQQIVSELRVKSANLNTFDWSVKTPFRGYKVMSLSANMRKNKLRPSAEMKLKLGKNKVYSIEGDLDTTAIPMNGKISIRTPFDKLDFVDISFTHLGQLKDFQTTATVDSKPTGRVDTEVQFRYVSPTSFQANAELTSPITHMEELRFSAENEKYGREANAHFLVGWEPNKKIEMDGSYQKTEGWSSESHTGTVTLSTPFEVVKTTTINMKSTQNGDKYAESLSASLNENQIVDMDVEVITADRPEMSIDMNKPYPMEMKLTIQKDRIIGGDVYVNWNKRHPEHNLRFQSSFTPNGGRFDIDKEFNVKLIHPVRTMGVSGVVQTSDNTVKSHGAIIWNDHKGQRLGYELNLSEKNRRNHKMINGDLKIELPMRTIALEGSTTNAPARKNVDGSIMWDSGRDESKKFGFKASLEPGQRTNKVDLTLSLPSIKRDIRIGSEMTVYRGRVIFDGKTELSYSPDSRKTLILTSNVKDVSYDRTHKNYTMSLGISHPYTDTDVQLTSHIGRSTDKYSTGVELQYLTASRTQMNMVLLGEIDQLRRQINIEVINPLKKMKLSGEVESMSPFHATLKNMIDDKPSVSAALSYDEKTFEFQTNYDNNDLSKSFHLEGKYVNSSAIRTEAYTMINGQRTVENVMSARLNTSRILHSRITWRPAIVEELKMFSHQKLQELLMISNHLSQEAKAQIGRELSHKYNQISENLAEEIKPYVALVSEELVFLEEQLKNLVRDLRRMHSRNDLYIRDMGDKVQNFYYIGHTNLRELIGHYKQSYESMIGSVSSAVQQFQAYPIRQKYYEALYKAEMMSEKIIEDVNEYIETIIADIRQCVEKHTNLVQAHVNDAVVKITNHPRVQMLHQKLQDLKNANYGEYLTGINQKLGDLISSMKLGEHYNDAINNIHSAINGHFDQFMKRDDVKYVHSMANAAYQEGKWAYGYWQVENNAKLQLQELKELLKQMVREEIEKFKAKFSFIPSVNVTYFNPTQGELQADVYLPLPLTSLDRLPTDLYKGYIQDMKNMADKYLPTQDSLKKMYDDYFPAKNQTDVNGFKKDLQEYLETPTKTRKRARSFKARGRKFRQLAA
ncbi:uncharacterized protein LOC126819071 [Patella vulgata]|uniref:uncharacterized protein LOC126819071 n=1 Tax=Patella vulgata TaxID=6465 RepID=UPI00217FB34B|nr:uncharacterized protein LOC126819071 [Patella vulgata]